MAAHDGKKEARNPRKERGANDHRAPNHISKTVLSTVHFGPPKRTRTKGVSCVRFACLPRGSTSNTLGTKPPFDPRTPPYPRIHWIQRS